MTKIRMISDLHVGTKFCRIDLIKKALKGDDPIMLGGDLVDGINPKDPRYDSDCNMTIDEQINCLLSLLKGKNIISMIDGNHDQSLTKYTGVNVLNVLHEQLDIPYDGPNVYVEIDNKIIYNYHGTGGGAFKGTILQKLEKVPMHRSADVYVQGHSHQLFTVPTIVEYRGKMIRNWLINSGSFLADATYARSKNLPPSLIGYAIYDTELDYAYPVVMDMNGSTDSTKSLPELTEEELGEFYKTHSLKETVNYFDVSERTIMRRVKKFGLSKRNGGE